MVEILVEIRMRWNAPWTLLLVATMSLPIATAAADENAQEATPAAATSADDAAALRREIEALKKQIQVLQDQMKLLLSQGAAPAGAGAPPLAPAPPAPVAKSQSVLNPAISAVFQSIGNTSLKRSDQANGFDLSEAEVAMQSVVDPYIKVDLFLSFPAGDSPEVEEGFLSTTALPGSLTLKAGRFKSAFGKWNTFHTHAFFSVDRPAVLTQFFGEESLTDDGLSLSALIPNPWGLYIESISEVGTPREGESFNSSRRSLNYLEHLSGFFSPTANSSIEVGLSATVGRTGPDAELIEALSDPNLAAPPTPADHLDSAVGGLDVTYKWKPLQMNTYRSFLWQTEWLASRRHVEELQASGSLRPDVVSAHGGYTYVEGQFAKRWRVGARYDLTEMPFDSTARIRGASLVVRFIPSEFQELRFQAESIRRNDPAAALFNGENDDTRLFFEWIPVIGAHGAHKY